MKKICKIILFLVVFDIYVLAESRPAVINNDSTICINDIEDTTKIMKIDTLRKKALLTKYNLCKRKMANGEKPKFGYVAVSDRSIPLNSIAIVNGKSFIIGDYTSRKTHLKNLKKGFEVTVDIFSKSLKECLAFGKKEMIISIIII